MEGLPTRDRGSCCYPQIWVRALHHAVENFANRFVPEGHLRIAQRFIAGNWKSVESQVPEGRLKPAQSSPRDSDRSFAFDPSVETLGYCHSVPNGTQNQAIPNVGNSKDQGPWQRPHALRAYRNRRRTTENPFAMLLGIALYLSVASVAPAQTTRGPAREPATPPRRVATPPSSPPSATVQPPVAAEPPSVAADAKAKAVTKPEKATATPATRESILADFVPASANLFVSIRNLRALDAAFRRVHAWPLLSAWSREDEGKDADENDRAPDVQTALAVLLGPTTSINLNEFMEAEVAIVAADWADPSHLLWLVRVRDATAIDRWFPPDRRLAKHAYPSAHGFRMDNVLVVTARGNLFTMRRRWTDDRVLVDTMRLLQGTGGESLGADPEYRSLVSGLPGGLLSTASFLLDDDAEKSVGPRNDAVDAITSLLPVGRRLVIGVAENRGGLEVIARGTGAFAKGSAEVGAASVTQLLSLPSTTILATASTISGPSGAPISSFAKASSARGRYARMFDALHRAGPRGATALPSIGPGWILAWDQDVEGSGAAPQAALLVQCRDAARLAEDARAIVTDFAKVFVPIASGQDDESPIEVHQHAYRGDACFSVPLASIAGGSTHPVLRWLRGAEISWAAADDWLVLTLGREHLERILDARAGHVLPLRGLKEAPRLGSHPTDYRFVALVQPASAANVVERWRGRIAAGPFVHDAATSPGADTGFAETQVPLGGIGFTLAAERLGGAAVVETVDGSAALQNLLRSGDVILGVDGRLLAMEFPAADLRQQLLAGGEPTGKTLRVQRAGSMLEITVPSPPATPAAAPETDDAEALPALEALEDLLSAARTVSAATIAIEGGVAERYSARVSLRFVPLPQGTKRAEGK